MTYVSNSVLYVKIRWRDGILYHFKDLSFYRFDLLNENFQFGWIGLICLLQSDIEGVSKLNLKHGVGGSWLIIYTYMYCFVLLCKESMRVSLGKEILLQTITPARRSR